MKREGYIDRPAVLCNPTKIAHTKQIWRIRWNVVSGVSLPSDYSKHVFVFVSFWLSCTHSLSFSSFITDFFLIIFVLHATFANILCLRFASTLAQIERYCVLFNFLFDIFSGS